MIGLGPATLVYCRVKMGVEMIIGPSGDLGPIAQISQKH